MAYALSHFPIQFLAILALVIGSYVLYVSFNAGANKLAMYSIVFWMYGLSLYGFMVYFNILSNIQFVLFIFVNVLFLIWLSFGYIVLFKKGTDEQRIQIKQVPIQLFRLLIQGILLLLLITIFFKWIKPLF